MFWADKVASEIIDSGKYTPYWVDDMKTPSGRVHVGALRGVVVHDLVERALKDKGKNAKFTYVFEDHDPMDDIPAYLPREKFEKYLGMPLFKIPSPVDGYENYARYYASDFEKVFREIGCEPEIIWTKDLYTSGKMNPIIKEVLDNASEVRKIYEELYDKKLADNWYPFSVYCPNCGKVTTTTVTEWDGELVTYECVVDKVKYTNGCGEKGKISPYSNENGIAGKMPWKVEWPAKWKAIGITVEGAGKDHMSKGGSHDLASQVCKRVINYPVPYPIAYEWILIGGRKMSSSRGVGFAASDTLEILPPELIRFLFVKIRVNTQVNFDPSDPLTIPSLFDEYQKAANAYFNKTDEDLARIFEFSQIGEVKKPPSIRFSVLSQWVQMPNMTEEIEREGLSEWAKFARVWVERFAPDDQKFEVQKELPENIDLSEKQKELLAKTGEFVLEIKDPTELQTKIYELGKELELSSGETFEAFYKVLIGKNHGPKLAWLITSLDPSFIKERLKEVSGQQKVTVDIRKGNSHLNKPEVFSIDKDLTKQFPSISVGIAIIKDVSIKEKDEELENEKEELLRSLEDLTTEELGIFPEIVSYRKLYKEMGIDWHSRRPSPEALLRRIALKKGLYSINTAVDAYNLVVMKNRVSVGAFDFDKIKFPTILRLAKPNEKILLLGDTEPIEYSSTEVAYFDQDGGYNMDFNYRDAQRTAVNLNTKNLYINVDGVFEITPEQVEETLREACNKIIKYCGGKIELIGVDSA